MRVLANPASRVFSPQFLAIAGSVTPYLQAYEWENSAPGWGSKYADPATPPLGDTYDNFEWSNNNADIVAAHEGLNYVSAYPFTYTGGFGTKYADPATIPNSQGRGAAFNPDDTALFISSNGTNSQAYAYTVGSGFGTRYTDPSPAQVGTGASWSPSGGAVTFARNITPQIRALAWNNGFGTAYTSPASSGTAGNGTRFNKAGNRVGYNSSATPWMQVFPWDDSTGFGTKITDPATLPGRLPGNFTWNPSDTVVAVPLTPTITSPTAPRVRVYAWSNSTGWGTLYAQPSTDGYEGSAWMAFNKTGTTLAFGSFRNSPNTGNEVYAYAWSDSTGFGTKYAQPAGGEPFGGRATNVAEFSN